MGSKPKSPEQPGLSNSQIREIEGLLSNLGDSLTATGNRQMSLLRQQQRLTQRQSAATRRTSRQTSSAMNRYMRELREGESRRERGALGNAIAANAAQRRIDFSNQNAVNQSTSDYLKAAGTANFNLTRAISLLR